MVKKRRNRQKMASNVASDDSIETIQRISDEVLLERGNPAKTPPKMSSEAPKSKSSIKSTPKIRRFKRLNRTFNVTNLNILFDSSYINQTTPERASTTIVATPATADGQANAARNVETVFSRFKRYSRTSLRWPDKFIHFCSTIGFTVKRTLSGIYSRYSLEKVEESKCRCGEYRREIFELRCKVDELRMEMDGVKLQLELQKQTDVGKMLDKDVVEIVRIGVLKEIETQLREMAEKVNNNQASINLFTNSNYAISTPVSSTCVLIGGGGGGPPPPPPPPPPLPPLFVPTNNDLKITKKDRSECGNGSNKENSRPVIALDDILKVKLKKATERPRLQRRATQPAISTEMIRNVKLKPASRPQTPLLDTEIISTSPCSSLVRLLSESSGNSIPVGKVKRLKRTRGYSFDDLSRKTQTATTRWGDRERTTYN